MKTRGTWYYIDPEGSDANDGFSPDTPLRTFQKIREIVLRPGDRVLLKCGGVWNEELTIAGQGAPDAFIEISSYGTGDRPVIRRNGHIGDRCVRLNNPSYLRLGNLEVCNGGAGIVLFYDHSYHNRSVYLHDITAHDFGGIYRASGESSCNEEWKAYRSPDRVGFSLGICVTGNDSTPMNGERVLSDFRISDCEVYRTGGGIGLDWCDHVCCDGAIAGKNKFGDVLWERLYLHDNDIPDVSLTSLFLQCVTGAVLRDSVIDKGAGGAPGGTAAIHLQLARDVLVENVTIRNMPHTDVSDECGIDFATDVEDCIIRRCVFENNAGPAVEFLANYDVSDQASSRDIILEECTFLRNNWACLYANPAQILVQDWQRDNRPTGRITGCRYENPAGAGFLGGDGGIDGFVTEGNIDITLRAEVAAL